MWNQTQNSQLEGQLEVIKKFCYHLLSIEKLVSQTSFTIQKFEECLKILIKHDIIKQN